MRIGIIGGGISGLYMASLLKKDHEVFIIEKKNWGGDMQHCYLEDKCYPVSTVFVMPTDKLLKKTLKKLNINTVPVNTPLIYLVVCAIILVICWIVCMIFFSRKQFMLPITLCVCITIVSIILYIKNYMCSLILKFGARKDCSSMMEVYTFNPYSLYKGLSHPIEYPLGCGMSAIVESFLHSDTITYLDSSVINVIRGKKHLTIKLQNEKDIVVDKCVITCKYTDYSSFIELSKHEKDVLSGIEYFDFYSTLIRVSGEGIPFIPNSLGNFKLDPKTYLVASHTPNLHIDRALYVFKKTYHWRMPEVPDRTSGILLNKETNRTVYFTGKEMAGNGVNKCMEYTLIVSRLL